MYTDIPQWPVLLEGVYLCVLCHVRLIGTSWTATHQSPLSMEFPRQEWWGGLPFPSPRNLPNLGTELKSLASPELAGGFFTTEPLVITYNTMHTVER